MTRTFLRTACGAGPIYGPTKGRRARILPITPHTLSLLEVHKAVQDEVRAEVGTRYHDNRLVFAKDDPRRRTVGDPLQSNNLGQRGFAGLISQAGVRPITFHGLRHTCATLLLKARVPIIYVAERLGHRSPDITMRIYGHCMPSGQIDMIRDIGGILREGPMYNAPSRSLATLDNGLDNGGAPGEYPPSQGPGW